MKYLFFYLFLLSSLLSFGQNTNPYFGITEFSINGIYATINSEQPYVLHGVKEREGDEDDIVYDQTIFLYVPHDVSLYTLRPIIKTTEGAQIIPASGEWMNFVTYNFQNYAVASYVSKNKNSKEKKYGVFITKLKPDEPQILSFTFNVEDTIISPDRRSWSDNSIYIKVPDATDLSHLTPNIVLTDSTTISPQLNTPQDFDENVTYTLKHKEGKEITAKIVVYSTDIQIDRLSNDTVMAGDTVSIYGHFASHNNQIALGADRGHFEGIYFTNSNLIFESDSLIQVVIPEVIAESTSEYYFHVRKKEANDSKSVFVLNPRKPLIEGLDRSSMILGEDSLVVRGQRFQNVKKAFLYNPEVGTTIVFEASSNNEGTELVLNKTPIDCSFCEDIKTGICELYFSNGYSISTDDVSIELIVKEKEP